MQIMENFELLVTSVGLRRDASAEYNEGQLEKYFADTPDGAERRARVDHVFELTRSELGCLDLDIGFTYPDGAIVDDGLPFPPRDPADRTSVVSGKSVSVRVDLGGRRIIQKKKTIQRYI